MSNYNSFSTHPVGCYIFHADLKAIKAFEPIKKVSVVYLLRFLIKVVLELMPWCQYNVQIYIYIYISSRFIFSKIILN